jgi:hypothetical protein
MALSQWDRDYIEHLIRREAEQERKFHEEQEELSRKMFMGWDPFYWDISGWPHPPGIQRHHEMIAIQCPGCGSRIDLDLKGGSCYPGGHTDHKVNCEFFRGEQRQWVDDYADLRHDCQRGTTRHGYSRVPLLRSPTPSEKTLLQILTQDPEPSSCYQIAVRMRDYQLVREVIEVPSFR